VDHTRVVLCSRPPISAQFSRSKMAAQTRTHSSLEDEKPTGTNYNEHGGDVLSPTEKKGLSRKLMYCSVRVST
jgi:hypothetical protein